MLSLSLKNGQRWKLWVFSSLSEHAGCAHGFLDPLMYAGTARCPDLPTKLPPVSLSRLLECHFLPQMRSFIPGRNTVFICLTVFSRNARCIATLWPQESSRLGGTKASTLRQSFRSSPNRSKQTKHNPLRVGTFLLPPGPETRVHTGSSGCYLQDHHQARKGTEARASKILQGFPIMFKLPPPPPPLSYTAFACFL